MKADVSVDMIQFTLFLYIQHVHKISLRESLVGGEEYPLISLLLWFWGASYPVPPYIRIIPNPTTSIFTQPHYPNLYPTSQP